MENTVPGNGEVADPAVFDPVADAELDVNRILMEERRCAKADPMYIINAGYLRIKNKQSLMVCLSLNDAQQKLAAVVREKRLQKRPVRIAILKGRQFGISTYSEGVLFCNTSQRANTNSMIISSDEDSAENLFEMSKLFYEKLMEEQPHLVPLKKKSNEKKLEFDRIHSQILIDTAKNVKAGRSYTLQNVHLAEAAFFPFFNKTLSAISQAVPDEPETYVFVETTANGENEFCLWWRKIKTDFHNGTTDWVPLFLSWKDHKEYDRPFRTESEQAHFLESMSEKEKMIQLTHQLTLTQMNWRRWTIINKCAGSEETFQQEYPLDDEEAFLTSGRRVFDHMLLAPQLANVKPPILKGDLAFVNYSPIFVPDPQGALSVWETPKKGHRYVIGADSAEGSSSTDDFAAAHVFDATTRRIVGVLHGKIPPDIFGDKLNLLGRWFNYALVIPEINNQGLVTALKLRDLHYPNIGKRMRLYIEEGIKEEREELGFNTNSQTKPLLVNTISEVLREVSAMIPDEQTLTELRQYMILGSSATTGALQYGAGHGFHDDRVIALGITLLYSKNIALGVEETILQRAENIRSSKITGY